MTQSQGVWLPPFYQNQLANKFTSYHVLWKNLFFFACPLHLIIPSLTVTFLTVHYKIDQTLFFSTYYPVLSWHNPLLVQEDVFKRILRHWALDVSKSKSPKTFYPNFLQYAFFACIPFIYQNFISRFVYCQFLYWFAFIPFHTQREVFLFTYTNHILLHLMYTNCIQFLDTFYVFLLTWIVILINADFHHECIPQIYHPCGHWSNI